MFIDAEFKLTIKMSDMFMNPNQTEEEIRKKIKEEGEKRFRYYLSGYLFDPEGKSIGNEINYKVKEK
jgi:hypothetical protein